MLTVIIEYSQWAHNRERGHQGILGKHAKLDEPFEKSCRTEASGDVLQRGHDQVPGVEYRIHLDPLFILPLTVFSFCVRQVSAEGIQSTPLNLAVSWRGDAASTDLRVDYKYNMEAMAAPVPLHDILFLVPVDGGHAKVQAMVPPATW